MEGRSYGNRLKCSWQLGEKSVNGERIGRPRGSRDKAPRPILNEYNGT